MSKQEEYLQLIEEIKACHLCENIKAPAFCKDGEFLKNDSHGYDENEKPDLQNAYVNRWNLWHGNLDADIMVIGQDYGRVKDDEELSEAYWREVKPESWKFTTDYRLHKLFVEVFGEGFDLTKRNLPLYFTNIACCYRQKDSTSAMNDAWYPICANRYMGRLIRIIRPKMIICLGQIPFSCMGCLEGFSFTCESANYESGTKPTLKEILDSRLRFVIEAEDMDRIPVVPVYHPGAKRNRNRSEDLELKDWKEVAGIYEEQCGRFDEKKRKLVEKYAYLQLDHLNHHGAYAEMRDYITFDYNGKVIVDPWQREDFQVGDCIWVEYDDNMEAHQGEHVVDPFDYYGSERMNDFMVRMLGRVGVREIDV